MSSSPMKRIEPVAAGVSPTIALHSVVLPMPLRPTSDSTPRASVRSTPCSAWLRPEVELSPLISKRLAGRRSAMAAPEIEFLHLRIGFDFGRRAFLEDAAVVHHCHAL